MAAGPDQGIPAEREHNTIPSWRPSRQWTKPHSPSRNQNQVSESEAAVHSLVGVAVSAMLSQMAAQVGQSGLRVGWLLAVWVRTLAAHWMHNMCRSLCSNMLVLCR